MSSKKKEKFVSFISAISILGVCIGVMALIVVLAVMTGFDNDLRDKIVGANPHILIESPGGIENPNKLLERLERNKQVLAASAYLQGQAMIGSEDRVTGVAIRGIDPSKEYKVTNIQKFLRAGSLDSLKEGDRIIIGRELALSLGVGLEDELNLISPFASLPYPFRVTGIFNSGMYDYDMNLAFISLSSAQKIFASGELAGGVGLRLKDPYLASGLKNELQEELIGSGYVLRSWMDINKNLFSALKLEKTTMFIILTLIVIVASFNIVSALMVMVTERTKDIGILKSIGAQARSISRIFTFEGLIIGLLGTTLGTLLGVGLCFLLEKYKFIKLPQDIYYIDTLPVELQWQDLAIIALAAMCIAYLSTLYPSRKAAKLEPVEAIRYE